MDVQFAVVDIPTSSTTGNDAIIEALINNAVLGKAVEVPLGTKNSNDYRKVIRARLNTKGVLVTNHFRTKTTDTSLIMWLEAK